MKRIGKAKRECNGCVVRLGEESLECPIPVPSPCPYAFILQRLPKMNREQATIIEAVLEGHYHRVNDNIIRYWNMSPPAPATRGYDDLELVPTCMTCGQKIQNTPCPTCGGSGKKWVSQQVGDYLGGGCVDCPACGGRKSDE